MFDWLFKKKSKKFLEWIDFGQYNYKPVVIRAISVVAARTNNDIARLVDKGLISLNKKVLKPENLQDRLEAGSYELTINNVAIYTFYIL